ncbi:serine hydrolase domain-containing protein [candidate division KSB1 bacterium]
MILGFLRLMLFYCSPGNSTQIDAVFAEFNKQDVPGASVTVIEDGKIIYKKGYGLANLETREKADEYTNYRLASVTKQFTAMCIMILKEKGLLDYENTLTDIYPDFPDYGKKVTIKNLLQHTSGLIAYEDLIPDAQTEQVHDKDVLDLMKQQDSTYYEPGSKYRYSNSGYAVLAMTVEKLSGKRFSRFLKDNIFTPLGMENTVAYEKGISTIENRAFGYAEKEGSFEGSDQSVTSAVLGDGGIYTSVMDYYKWDQTLYTNKLVSLETINEAFTPGKLNDGSTIETGYGFGWFTGEVKGIKWVGHSGSTCGFRTYVLRIPEKKFTVVVLINRRDPEAQKYAYEVANLYTDGLFEELLSE